MGASGLIFGLFGYLLSRGFVDRRPLDVVVGLIVGVLYGSILWGVLPTPRGVLAGPSVRAVGGGGRGVPSLAPRGRTRCSHAVEPAHQQIHSAKTKSVMPMTPLTVKNARFSRDRSCGSHDRVLVEEGAPATTQARSTRSAPAPVAAPYQTSSAVVTAWQTRAP